jgi:hypothetical protein
MPLPIYAVWISLANRLKGSAMDRDELNAMTIEQLWALHLSVKSELSRRIVTRKKTLDRYQHAIRAVASK